MERIALDMSDVSGVAHQRGTYAGASMDGSDDLIARARRGDEEAFRLIFERYTRPVISFIFYTVNRRELAEELAQETFVRAYRSIGALRDDTKLSTWLFGIAKNVAREALRSRSREALNAEHARSTAICDERAAPDKKLLEKELNGAMGRALDALDEDKRLVFTLKVYQQRSYQEIVEITGFSLPKIRNDLYRARIELRRRMSPYLGANDDM